MSRTVCAAAAVVIAGVVGSATAVQVSRPVAFPTVHVAMAATESVVTQAPVPVQLPPQGSLALATQFGEPLATLAAAVPRPIGSVAKAMTALVVLDAHPLRTSQDDGPMLTMTGEDVALYRSAIAADGSSIPVTVGERLSERELLLALMLPSANNIAETLARWVGGTRAAFVAELNARALRLGMGATHFVDPSGYDPATVSSAADLVKLGRAVLANPALASIVATPSATLPDGTPVENLDTLLTIEPGWLGIKTGETPMAGGCLLFAVRRAVPGGTDSVTMIGAVLGQTDLAAALDAARTAVRTAYAGFIERGVCSFPVEVVRGELVLRVGRPISRITGWALRKDPARA